MKCTTWMVRYKMAMPQPKTTSLYSHLSICGSRCQSKCFNANCCYKSHFTCVWARATDCATSKMETTNKNDRTTHLYSIHTNFISIPFMGFKSFLKAITYTWFMVSFGVFIRFFPRTFVIRRIIDDLDRYLFVEWIFLLFMIREKSCIASVCIYSKRIIYILLKIALNRIVLQFVKSLQSRVKHFIDKSFLRHNFPLKIRNSHGKQFCNIFNCISTFHGINMKIVSIPTSRSFFFFYAFHLSFVLYIFQLFQFHPPPITSTFPHIVDIVSL